MKKIIFTTLILTMMVLAGCIETKSYDIVCQNCDANLANQDDVKRYCEPMCIDKCEDNGYQFSTANKKATVGLDNQLIHCTCSCTKNSFN